MHLLALLLYVLVSLWVVDVLCVHMQRYFDVLYGYFGWCMLFLLSSTSFEFLLRLFFRLELELVLFERTLWNRCLPYMFINHGCLDGFRYQLYSVFTPFDY